MFCGRCCVMEPRSRPALRLDIFIEILLRRWMNKGKKKGRDPRSPALKTDDSKRPKPLDVGPWPSC
jgi:hypothetical protein